MLAPGQGGLKRGLKDRRRTVVLMLDETFILETPPLRAGWAKVGVQAEVPMTGNHARRVIHGALNITSGHVAVPDHGAVDGGHLPGLLAPGTPGLAGVAHRALCRSRLAPYGEGQSGARE